MTYKNIFSFEPSELHAAEEIVKREYEVFFPVKDEAVDLLAIKKLSKGKRRCITIQVKASRMFEKGLEEGLPRFWIKLDPNKMIKYRKKVDYYIFVFYKTEYKTDKVPSFSKEFLVIPTNDLIVKSRRKKGWKKGWLNYYFVLYPKNKIVDLRDVNRKNLATEKKKAYRNYGEYRNNFELIK